MKTLVSRQPKNQRISPPEQLPRVLMKAASPQLLRLVLELGGRQEPETTPGRCAAGKCVLRPAEGFW